MPWNYWDCHGFKIAFTGSTFAGLARNWLELEFLLGGKLATILTDFFDFSKLCFLISGTAVLVDLGIHTYHDGWQLSLLYLTEPESEE